MNNCIMTKNGRRKVTYMYFDISEYLADQIFIDHRLPVRWEKKELMHPDHPYRCVFAKVRKQDEDEFLLCMEELRRKMLLTGHTDYDDVCKYAIEYAIEHILDQSSSADVEYTVTKGMLNEWEEESLRIYNLNLYVEWIEKNRPDVFMEMEKHFDGLPGYERSRDEVLHDA